MLHQDYAVLFLLKDLQGAVGVGRRNDHFKKYGVDLAGSLFVDSAVGDEHSAERADRVAGQSVAPCLGYGGAGGHAASVVVLEHREGRVGEFGDQTHCGVDVKQIVVGYFLAVELCEHFLEIAEEVSLLMGILAIAHVLGSVDGHTQGRGTFLAVEVVEYGCIVAAAHGKGFLGKPPALTFGRCRALSLEHVGQRGILGFGSHDDNVTPVFGGGTYKRYAAYVYLLDDIGIGGTGRHCGFKGIQVNDHQVYLRNLIAGYLLAVAGVLAAVEYAAEHLGMKSLHPTSKNRGVAGKILHRIAFISKRFYKRLRAAGRKELHAVLVEEGQDFVQTVFVKHGY